MGQDDQTALLAEHNNPANIPPPAPGPVYGVPAPGYPPQYMPQPASYQQQPVMVQGAYQQGVYGAQPVVVYSTHHDPCHNDEDHVTPAVLILIFGFFLGCVWLGGFAYYRSRNHTARVLSRISIGLFFFSLVMTIFVIIYFIAMANEMYSRY
eukprot:TRINITY_DN1264_c0_g1_i2.p1 TRINITY_DN1264_c0_g1~~TRINITY_DN1264_c0_g1_i2.p1  ORF type:complete len:152 (-),score=41.92 TRINITY_DN1264_c0_g1_i2:233-688(-)